MNVLFGFSGGYYSSNGILILFIGYIAKLYYF